MLELSLFSQIPAARHDQVLKILAGVAAMPPTSTLERYLVHQPMRQPSRTITQAGGTQGVQTAQKAGRQGQSQIARDLYYLQLVEDLTYLGKGHNVDEDCAVEKNARSDERSRWFLRFYDVPEAARRTVVGRTTSVTPVLEGDALLFMKGLGYQFVHEYVVEGHQMVCNNVVLHLHRSLRKSNSGTMAAPLPSSDQTKALEPTDENGAYLLHAYVRVQDGSSPDVVTRGTAELIQLKDMLKGAIDLRVVDRLSLDMRVK